MSHTPGPWVPDAGYVWTERDKDGDRELVADVNYVRDACLVAAAPELYDALVFITGAMEASGGWEGDDEAFKRGMDALRKAEGR